MQSGSHASGGLAYKWRVTIALALGMIMSLMDMTIVNVAIPQMQRSFGASIDAVQWVVTIYMLTQAAVIPTAPYIQARLGGKRAYVLTLTAFLVGSLLCGLAWNLPSLIFFRFVQGIGGGILLPMVMSLQYQAFPAHERGLATSVMGIPLLIAPMLGPVLGGYLVTSFGWQWAFLINVPIGIVAVTIALRILRESTVEKTAHFDLMGFLTAAFGSAFFIYGVSSITNSSKLVTSIISLSLGIIIIGVFALIELSRARRGQEVLLDLRLFKDRTFAFSSLTLVFFSIVLFGLFFLIPIYLQTLHQETALQAGMIQTAQALATLAILPLIGRFSGRVGARVLVLLGLTLLSIVTALMTILTLDSAIWIVVGILILLGWANGLAQQIPVSAMSNIRNEEQKEVAHGSTLVTVLRAIAAPTGVALLSGIVQTQSQQYIAHLVTQGIKGASLLRQSSLLAMHESFLVAFGLTILALITMYFVPGRKKRDSVQDQTSSLKHDPKLEAVV